MQIDAAGSAVGLGTKTGYSFHYLRWTVFLHLFLFVGMAWAAFQSRIPRWCELPF